ncbi:MAG: apolipoprotein N-acyltransferase [Candidatus Schekmanbacteria bacterium]|nr:apolipoprotein N-acyltransferase [Candidatus Schekmanbacteria bacterium]
MKSQQLLSAVFAGVCLVLIFPKWGIGTLAWAALIPLLLSIKDSSPAESRIEGIITGYIYFSGTLYWIPYTLEHYGKLPLLLSWGILLLMAAILSLYVGLFAWGINRVRNFLLLPLITAAFWVSVEYLRTYLFSGFPWVLLGCSQVSFLPVIQCAEFTGIYGVSFLIVLVNAVLTETIYNYQQKRPLPRIWLAATAGLLIINLFFGQAQLKKPKPSASLKIAVTQGNIPQEQKWDKEYQAAVFQTYHALTLHAAEKFQPELIVWPEASTPFLFESDAFYRPRLLRLAKDSRSFLLFGSPGYKLINREYHPFNAAYLISPQGEELGNYQKIHLVPFGEYVPMEWLFSFTGKLVAQAGNFIGGTDYQIFVFNNHRFAAVICYEIIFPDLVRRFVKKGADFLVTITNDAWFGPSAAPYQHFYTLIFRAVENRRYIVRSANTGISGFVDPYGRILKQGGLFTRESLGGEIAPLSELTFYTKYGDVFAGACLLIVIISIVSVYLHSQKRNKPCKKN